MALILDLTPFPPDTGLIYKMLNDKPNINENTDFVYSMIEKYTKKSHAPIKNTSINIEAKEIVYKLVRLNDEQFYLLHKNSIPIFENYTHLMYLSTDKDIIFSSFSKMYITLKDLFGESGKHYDDWKGSFSFPFLIYFRKEEKEFGYIMNIHNIRSSIEFNIAKLIHADNENLERHILHNPFDEFPREEITYFIKVVSQSNHIVYN
ncbi:hypothetical protein D5085_10305 [Ectothiorhodospiraceae bacterium BW-2]|nr:hypothetical protein D5085_10305 [Ectothiorhodospiraceae bacterium BW-2]